MLIMNSFSQGTVVNLDILLVNTVTCREMLFRSHYKKIIKQG